jgi:hypothetical protein
LYAATLGAFVVTADLRCHARHPEDQLQGAPGHRKLWMAAEIPCVRYEDLPDLEDVSGAATNSVWGYYRQLADEIAV